jgi:hypothetical protein
VSPDGDACMRLTKMLNSKLQFKSVQVEPDGQFIFLLSAQKILYSGTTEFQLGIEENSLAGDAMALHEVQVKMQGASRG